MAPGENNNPYTFLIKIDYEKDNWWDKIRNFVSFWWGLALIGILLGIALYFSLPAASCGCFM